MQINQNSKFKLVQNIHNVCLKIAKNFNLLNFLNNFELLLLLSCNQIHIEVVISIKHGWNNVAWVKIIYLGHYPYQPKNQYQQQHLKNLLILQGHKNSQRKIFGTSCIIINLELIIFLNFVKKTVI